MQEMQKKAAKEEAEKKKVDFLAVSSPSTTHLAVLKTCVN